MLNRILENLPTQNESINVFFHPAVIGTSPVKAGISSQGHYYDFLPVV